MPVPLEGKTGAMRDSEQMRDEEAGRAMMPASADEAGDRHWRWVRLQLRKEFGESQFDRWLKPVECASLSDGRARLVVPTDFIRDWVERNYLHRIRSLMAAGPGEISDVALEVAPQNRPQPASAPAQAPAPAPVASRAHADPLPVDAPGESLGGRLEPRYSFETFVVGKSNAFAHAAARRVAESQAVPFNPLFLHGGVGLGKTHLMHAIAWEYQKNNPGRRVVYISAEKFMYQFIAAVRYRDTMAFKKQFRSVDLLMIDDFQFISNKDSTQEEFFHTFNELIESRKQLVISADRSPTDLEGFEERIVSRLGWGLVADIHPTDYELRLGILQAKAEARPDIAIPRDILDFLARKIASNVRELEGALNRVIAYVELVGRPITLDVVREVLADLLRANDRKINIDEIQKAVAEHYNLRINEMLSQRRSRNIARPRQVAMYLAKQLTQRSLPEIGRMFNGRDHTTVIHAIRKVEELRCSDATLDDDIARLMRKLQG